MRFYLISLIALSVEKKEVDAVRRVPLLRSVTVSVVKKLTSDICKIVEYCENNLPITMSLYSRINVLGQNSETFFIQRVWYY